MDLSSLTDYGLIFDPVSVKFDISERVSDLIKGSPPPPLDDVRDTDSVSSDDVLVDSSSAEEEEEGGGSKDEEDITTETLAEIAQLKVCPLLWFPPHTGVIPYTFTHHNLV